MCVCTADLAVDLDRRLKLHSVGDVGIYVERGLGADMAYHGGQRFKYPFRSQSPWWRRYGAGRGSAPSCTLHVQGWSESGGRGRRGCAVAPR